MRIKAEGVARMSYASRSLNKLKDNKDLAQQERDIQCTAAVIYAAGSDTVRVFSVNMSSTVYISYSPRL